MELRWLEDYLTLVDCQNFTTAASLRNLSQPAFSRRIQALETWLGVELIDRGRKPFRFTATALEHESSIRNLVNQIYQMRNEAQSSTQDRVTLTLAAQHSLLVTSFLPHFLEKLAASINNLNYRVVSENMDTCAALFLKGEVDMLVVYETSDNKNAIPSHLSIKKRLGSDEMILVCQPDMAQPHHTKRQRQHLRLLTYPVNSFFGEIVWNEEVPRVLREHNATIACESAFAVGLREMTLAATGAAWLPRSIVLDDLKAGSLVQLDAISKPIPMSVVAHITKLSDSIAARQLREIF
jgi:DNA-binding transcriptional LysR family regulator